MGGFSIAFQGLTTCSSIRTGLERSYYLIPRKTWGRGSFVISISGLGGSLTENGYQMLHYVAIVEDAGPDKAIGVWFPDLPGCFSAGDDIDQALQNAEEALALYAEAEVKDGRALPGPRTLSALKKDSAAASDFREHMVALVPLKVPTPHAAE